MFHLLEVLFCGSLVVYIGLGGTLYCIADDGPSTYSCAVKCEKEKLRTQEPI